MIYKRQVQFKANAIATRSNPVHSTPPDSVGLRSSGSAGPVCLHPLIPFSDRGCPAEMLWLSRCVDPSDRHAEEDQVCLPCVPRGLVTQLVRVDWDGEPHTLKTGHVRLQRQVY